MRIGIFKISAETENVYGYMSYLVDCLDVLTDKQIILVPKHLEKIAKGYFLDEKHRLYIYEGTNSSRALKNLDYDELKVCDQIILYDDKIIGPLNAIDEMMDFFEDKTTDILGIYENYARYMEKKFYQRELYSHFIVLNKSVIESAAFCNFVKGIGESYFDEYSDLLNELKHNGFEWKTWIDSSLYKGKTISENVDIGMVYSYQMLRRSRVPFIPISALTNTYFLPGGDENPYKTIKYIEKNTKYDVDLIWDYLLRTKNLLDIKTAFHEEILLDGNISYKSGCSSDKKIAIFAHLYYEDLLDICFSYLMNVPSNIKIYIITSSNIVHKRANEYIDKNDLKNFKVVKKNNRGRDFSALLIAAKKYIEEVDYYCFIHDKKSHAGSPISSGMTWFNMIWDSLLYSREYIENIICTLESNKRIGVLAPPEPFHSEAIGGIGYTWSEDYDITQELAAEMGLKCQISPQKYPFIIGTAFWCKKEALDPLFKKKWKYSDFPDEPMAIDGTICHGLERVIPYVAQSQGYFSTYVLNPELASQRMVKLTNYLADCMTIMRDENIWDRQDGGVVFNRDKLFHMESVLRRIGSFIKDKKTIYIYGAGKYGNACFDILQHFGVTPKGFIVTKKEKAETMRGVRIYEYGEVKIDRNDGIIVALKAAFALEVIPTLLNDEIDNFISYLPI
ncbi:MAG: hypothetical protein E7302_17800 [Butyrivibrio sp.]|nr:hypothetical protein [Butyrivibrio sp.]